MSRQNSDQLFINTATEIVKHTLLNYCREASRDNNQERNMLDIRIKDRLNDRKKALIDLITTEMESKGSSSQLEAILAQILNANLNDIPEYEKCFKLICPNAQLNTINHNQIHISRTRNVPIPIPNVIDAFNIIMHTHNSQMDSQNNPHNNNQIKEEEKKVCITFKDLQREALNSTCAICLEKYEQTDEVEIRHCSHTFHKKCLIPWENSNRTNGKKCPCCRQ